MFEAKYFRDYKHSYMILPCGMAQPDKNYQCRLLTSNRFEEILHCSLRYVNGEAYFYYDISSRTTLENLYRGRQLSFRQVRELFEQLYGIYCRLGDAFMEESGLVLLPEYIFYDLSRKKYIGLYYPDYEEDKPYEALMDYLLEHMDSQDERLADYIYQLYERAEEGTFFLCDALSFLMEPEEIPLKEEKEQNIETAFTPDAILAPASVSPSGEEADLCGENLYGEEGKQPPASQKKNLISVFLMALSALGLVGIACIYGIYELSDEEAMTLFGCGALMGVCLFAGFVGMFRSCGKQGKRKETPAPSFREEASFPVSEAVSLERVLSREAQTGWDRPGQKDRGERWEEPENCGDTVFFDPARMAEYKLYALDHKNKRHIELTKFPYTVGKMAGCVDCVLADDSVSRIHARFEKEGNAVRLTDMNSTNGTFKNGRRLQPQETVDIEPGDEIRFGSLHYCYR